MDCFARPRQRHRPTKPSPPHNRTTTLPLPPLPPLPSPHPSALLPLPPTPFVLPPPEDDAIRALAFVATDEIGVKSFVDAASININAEAPSTEFAAAGFGDWRKMK